MSALDNDLAELKESVKSINTSYGAMEESMSMKWKQIRKLDTMEKDLNKLKYLSDLPNLFKKALSAFQSPPDGAKDVKMFDEPIQYYSDYSDILTDYKQTKFMISLYGEIKSYIARIKTYLNKELDLLSLPSCQKGKDQINEESKTITRYLLIFGEDRNHLKA